MMKGPLMNATVAAIVPLRHDSERVPGKNYRLFAGRPLYHHVVEQLLVTPAITEIVIDTDSSVIMEDAAKVFPSVRLIERPEHLRDGMIPMNEILLNTVSQVKADFYLQTHSTNPLIRNTTIQSAIEQFLQGYPALDSLFSVTPLKTRLWDEHIRPVNHNPDMLIRTQDLAPLFEENSSLFIFSQEMLQLRRNRIGERPVMFVMDRVEAWDIDEELDFAFGEMLYEALRMERK